MTTRRRSFLAAAAATSAAALLAACGGGSGQDGASAGGSGTPSPSGDQTLLQLVQGDPSFSLLAQAIDIAGLTGTLSDAGASLTLFAPRNDAFDFLAGRLGLGDGAGLVAGLRPQQWTDLLHFHLVPRLLTRDTLDAYGAEGGERPGSLYSFRGSPAQLIFVAGDGGLNIWDGAGRGTITLLRSDVGASNGVLHVPSQILLPRGVLTVSQTLRANFDSMSRFGEALTPDLIRELDEMENSTVFAPLNEVYGGLLGERSLREHILPERTLGSDEFPVQATYTTLLGQTTRLERGSDPPELRNGRSVLATLSDSTPSTAAVVDVDFFASNGVIHLLDKALVPA